MTRRPFAFTRRQILLLGWSVPVVLLGAYVATNALATTGQRDLRARWDAAVARGPIDAAALAARSWQAGEPVARVGIPAIGLDLVVVEGGADARSGPEHLPSTVVPGAAGVSVVTGTRFGSGSFFLGLDRIRLGDTVLVENLAGVVRMVVVAVETMPVARLGASRDSLNPALLLAAPSRAWDDGMRLVVRAEVRGGAR